MNVIVYIFLFCFQHFAGYNLQYFYHNLESDKPTLNDDWNCLSMHISGKLHDVECTNLFPFICEKEDPSNIENWEKSVRPLFPTDPSKKNITLKL